MKLALITLVALALTGSALAAPKSATLTIRHEIRGCHSWSQNGTSWRPSQAISLSRGGVLKVINHDVMPHTLIQVSGPKATVAGAMMNHMAASSRVTFRTKGTYVFKTRAGEDYMTGTKTIGADKVLRLVVTVA